MKMKQSAINYFELKALVNKIGKQGGGGLSEMQHNMYHKLVLALEAYGRGVVDDYPKLEACVRNVGYTKISKKMIENYKEA